MDTGCATSSDARRAAGIRRLHGQLDVLLRRAAELADELHPGLPLLGHTLLREVEAHPGARATDLAGLLGADKAAISRSLDRLVSDGLLEREAGHPGRRGAPLVLSPAGRRALAADTRRVRRRLTALLSSWDDTSLAGLGDLLTRFNASVGGARGEG